jgi:hypothetical protein
MTTNLVFTLVFPASNLVLHSVSNLVLPSDDQATNTMKERIFDILGQPGSPLEYAAWAVALLVLAGCVVLRRKE